MEFVRVKNKQIVQVFTDDNPVKIKGFGLIVNPKKVSLNKWKKANVYPVEQPLLNQYQVASEIILDLENKKAYREALTNADVDLSDEKEELKRRFIIKGKQALQKLWLGDDDSANGAIMTYFEKGKPSKAEETKFEAIKNAVIDKIQEINSASTLDELLTIK